MVRTLHTYLSRELVKVATLALIAFTLVLTVFAVMEPLRKQGLAPRQVATLFVYTLPVMLTLTMPVAALFATTIVYGRFSQENEFLACRASGISTSTILMPAIVLGAIVTAASLILSFLVTPHMVAKCAMAAKNNIREIVYHKLRADKCADYGRYNIHADYVDPEHDLIGGIVITETRKGRTAVHCASAARCQFGIDDEGEKYVRLRALHVVRMQGGARQETQQPGEILATLPLRDVLKDVLKEKPTWYDWPKLWRTLRNPVESSRVRQALADIRRLLAYDLLARNAVEAVQSSRSFAALGQRDCRFVIRASRARLAGPGEVVFEAANPRTVPDELELLSWPAVGRVTRDAVLRVEVIEIADGELRRIVTGDQARIAPTLDADLSPAGILTLEPPSDTPTAALQVSGNVTQRILSSAERLPIQRGRWVAGQIPLPAELIEQAETYKLADIYRNPEKITPTASIHARVNQLREISLARLRANILAELNGRTAYCLSCFLMVSLGAALGVIFRGGNLISAFALSVAPAAGVIVMILMGKEMVRNLGSSFEWGMVSIWASLAALLIANVLVYGRLLRR